MIISDTNLDTGAPRPTKARFNPLSLVRDFLWLIRTYREQNRCSHLFTPSIPVQIDGAIGSPQMHPHPFFAEKIQVRLQPFARVQVCFHCHAIKTSFGHNEHPIEKTLPGFNFDNLTKRA